MQAKRVADTHKNIDTPIILVAISKPRKRGGVSGVKEEEKGVGGRLCSFT